jgi:hypothetical protein
MEDVFTEDDLYILFESIATSFSATKAEYNKYALLFSRELNKALSLTPEETSCSFNDNSPTFADVVTYSYISSTYEVVITNTTVFYLVSNAFNRICLHIAGVMGLCSGQKIDSGLPKSNIYYSSATDKYPILLNNCNPYKCSKDYFGDYTTDYIPACVNLCPFGAICHKQTELIALPVDNDGQLLKLSELKMTEKPFA